MEEIIGRFLKSSPQAMAATKKLIREISGRFIDAELIRKTSEMIAEARSSAEGKEGLTAFLIKRKPYWDKE